MPAFLRRVSVLVVALLLGCSAVLGGRHAACAASCVGHYTARVCGVNAHVVRVDLRSPRVSVTPLVAPVEPGYNGHAPFWAFIRHHRPVAAINGTFFDTRNFRVTGNVVSHGRMLREGYVGNAIALDRDNQPHLVLNSGHMGRHTDWSKYVTAMGGGPTLLLDGRLHLDPRAEGFHDPGLFRLAPRTAIGYNDRHQLFMVAVRTPIDFHRLADVMRGLGAVNAISLDGGSSTALYYRGQMLSAPRRSLTNVLAVFERPVVVAHVDRAALGTAAISHDLTVPAAVAP